MSPVVLVAAFDTGAGLAAGERAARRAGLCVVETFSPFPPGCPPVDGGGPPARIRALGLAGGLTGLLAGLGFQAWSSAVSWPMNVGGKPYLAWPSWVPVAFELTILGAVAATVVAWWRGRSRGRGRVLPSPGTGDPVFLLAVEARDDRAVEACHAVLRECGARWVERPAPASRLPARGTSPGLERGVLHRRLAVISLAALLVAAVLWPDRTRPNLVFFPDMADSPAATTYSAAAAYTQTGDGFTASVPGTVPRGPLPLRYEATEEDALRAGVELQLPPELAGRTEPERGAALFRDFCVTCHGADGHGDGLTLKRGFQPPASLLTQKARDLPDGQLFHIITFGQKLMPAHEAQLSLQERWRLVQHIRSLQERLPVDPPPFDPALAPGETLP